MNAGDVRHDQQTPAKPPDIAPARTPRAVPQPQAGPVALPDSRTVVPEAHPWLVALSVLAGTFMVVLDSTVVNVCLPNVAGSLSATVEEATWALTTYLAANAVILPMTGWLANRMGRARLILLAVTGFTVASFLCGLSPTLPFLIACRIVQGLCGGLMQPLSQAVMLESFPPHERGEAMALWGLGIVAAPIFGPVIGGWLTDNYSWRWVFYINIPIGVLAFFLIRRFVTDPPYIRQTSRGIDYWGLSLLVIGIGALQVALDQGQKEDWFGSQWITGLLIVAGITLAMLIHREFTARHPIVDLRVFRDRTYAAGVLLMTLMGFVLFGSLIIFPILLQTLMGYSPLQSGIAMAPRGVGMLLTTPLVGVLIGRTDARKLVASGFALGVLTLYWFSRLNMSAGYWDYFWPQLIQGAGFSFLFVPLTTVTMDAIPNAAMGNATSIFNLMRNLGGSMGIAITQTFMARHRQIHTNDLTAHISQYSHPTQQALAGLQSAFAAQGSDAVTAAHRAQAALWGAVQRHAAMLAFNDAFLLLAAIFLVLMPFTLAMRRPQSAPSAAAPAVVSD
jgi:MFS transporter, DHA2 family, multidrug resistance protein